MELKSSASFKKQFKVKSHKILRLNTVEKQSNIEDKSPMVKKKVSSKVRINSLKTIYPMLNNNKTRKETEIQEELALAQSPLKLNKCKKYQTKLKLSAQSWLIHDMKTNQYKRGWKPNKPSEFNGLLRILILLCYCQIIKRDQKLKKIKVNINPWHLKQARIKESKKQENQLKWIVANKKTSKTLAKGSIVYLIDIVKAMVVSGNNELMEYGFIYCGYLAAQLKMSSYSGSNDNIVNLTQQREQQAYAEEFCRFCNQFYLPSLGFQLTRTFHLQQSYQLKSSANQISQLFIKGFFDHAFFRQTISLQTHSFYFKYQVGYSYWEDRMITLKSPYNDIKTPHNLIKNRYFCYLVYKGAKNFQALCYNTHLDILIVIEDTKFAMAQLDIQVLEKWYQTVTASEKNYSNPFSPPKSKKSLLPILAISKG